MQYQSLKNGLSKASCCSIIVARKAKCQLANSTSDKWQAAAELGSDVEIVKVRQTGQGGIQLAHTGVFIIMHTIKLFSMVSAMTFMQFCHYTITVFQQGWEYRREILGDSRLDTMVIRRLQIWISMC